jgi:enterochelin esterase-like enzyme
MFISKKKILVILSLLIAVTLVFVTMSPSGMATARVQPKAQLATTLNSSTVNDDGSVTFTLEAPQADEVVLYFEDLTGKAPSALPYTMEKDADGVWSRTMESLDPNWYIYNFTVDGLQIPDPKNLDISFYQAGRLWTAYPSSVWSYVFVPGPEADYMADALIPHGAVANVRYYSDVHLRNMEMLVYTPPGYNHDNRRYPVLYLYHGGGGLKTDWFVSMRANYILDNLIAQGLVEPMIIVSPEYNVRGCRDFSGDPFSQELLGNIIPAIEGNFRVAPGGKNRALAGLSSGAGCVMNALFWNPGEFAYIGAFSPHWTTSAQDDLVQNHPELISDPAVNKLTKLLWTSSGGLESAPRFLPLLDEYDINYTYVPGPEIDANYAHVWDTWRHHLHAFAQLLFK